MNWPSLDNFLHDISIFMIGAGLAFVATMIWVWLRKHKEKQAEDLPQHLMDGILHYMDNRFEDSVNAFRKVAESKSDVPEVYFILARLFRNHGDVERAVRIHQSISLRPGIDRRYKLKAMFELAGDLCSAGNTTRAKETYIELAKMAPAWPEPFKELRELAIRERNWQEATQYQERYRKLARGEAEQKELSARIFAQSGLDFIEKGEIQNAQKALRTAHQLAPNLAHVTYAFVRLYAALGKPKDVFRAIETAISQSVDAAPYLLNQYHSFARVFDELDRFDDFLTDKLAGRTPPVSAYLFSRIDRNFERGEDEDARAALMQHIELHGANPDSVALSSKFDPPLELENHEREKRMWECSHCGQRVSYLDWYCPKCYHWETLFPKVTT